MSIVGSDIVKRFSVSAAAGNTTAGSAATSLGDQISTTDITDATIGNLFDDLTGAEAAAGDTEYRCIFILNNHASLTLTGATITVQSQTASGPTHTLALDNIGITAKGSGSAQAAVIADESSAPSGVGSFGAGPLTIGDLAPGQCQAIWIKRVASAGVGNFNPVTLVLRVAGDTLP